MSRRKTLLIDFDGVLHRCTGFSAHLGEALPKARAACLLLSTRYRLVCFTSRGPCSYVESWLRANGFPLMQVTDRKQPAHIILDDRALCFQGVWDDHLLAAIDNFKPWWDSPTTLASADPPPHAGSELSPHSPPDPPSDPTSE